MRAARTRIAARHRHAHARGRWAGAHRPAGYIAPAATPPPTTTTSRRSASTGALGGCAISIDDGGGDALLLLLCVCACWQRTAGARTGRGARRASAQGVRSTLQDEVRMLGGAGCKPW
jgi:hypothetical protein